MSATVAVADYGMGNRRSVEKALEHVGARVSMTADLDELAAADGVVVPGVGAFPEAMRRLHAGGMGEVIAGRVAAGRPVLGICLGLQLAFETSTELGGADGLALVAGRVEPLAADGLKLPHIGWAMVAWERPSPLIEGLPDPCAFYHVHSFAPRPAEGADVLGRAAYGAPFASAVQHGSFFGVQFHPEKSSTHGLRLLANFTTICARAAVPA